MSPGTTYTIRDIGDFMPKYKKDILFFNDFPDCPSRRDESALICGIVFAA